MEPNLQGTCVPGVVLRRLEVQFKVVHPRVFIRLGKIISCICSDLHLNSELAFVDHGCNDITEAMHKTADGQGLMGCFLKGSPLLLSVLRLTTTATMTETETETETEPR